MGWSGIVENTFRITGRGTVFAVTLTEGVVQIGDRFACAGRDGVIRGIEMINYGTAPPRERDGLIGVLVDWSDVPEGIVGAVIATRPKEA